MNKILVLGSSGAGKSTVSKTLGNLLNIPVLHLDTIFWTENWVMRDKELYTKDLLTVLNNNQFIIDGNHNYNDTLQLRIKKADTIIYLNYNRFICFYGAIKRYFKYRKRTRDTIAPGCNEKIDFEFAKYILWDFPNKKKKKIFQYLKNDFNGKLYKFNNRKQLKRFLNEIGASIRHD